MRRIAVIAITAAMLLAAYLPAAGDAATPHRWCVVVTTSTSGPGIATRSCAVYDKLKREGVIPADSRTARGSYTYPTKP